MNKMNKVTAKKVRKYVHKDTSPEATARRRVTSSRNWDVLQLTNIVGQLHMIEGRTADAENYTMQLSTNGAHTIARLRLAIGFLKEVLPAIKAHNKDPKSNPLP
jgi:hypothetical protein